MVMSSTVFRWVLTCPVMVLTLESPARSAHHARRSLHGRASPSPAGNVAAVTGGRRRWTRRVAAGGLLALMLLPLMAGCTSGGPADGGALAAARPPATPTASALAATDPGPTSSVTSAAGPHRYVFPVEGTTSYAHTHHDYPASDIMAPCGRPVRAVTDGVVLEVSRVDRWDPQTNLGADRGGLSVSILGDDGVRYYGSHFSVITDGGYAGYRRLGDRTSRPHRRCRRVSSALRHLTAVRSHG